jgi:hypothetical protein
MRAKRISQCTLTSILGLIAAAAAADQTFSDGTFNDADWTHVKLFDSSPIPRVLTASQSISGGNPGTFQLLTQDRGNLGLGYAHLMAGAIYSPTVSGAIDRLSFSYDVQSFITVPGGGGFASFSPLLLQNGTYYTLSIDGSITLEDHAQIGSWVHWVHPRLLPPDPPGLFAADFIRSGAGPFHPDFSASGAPIQFGYFTDNLFIETGSGQFAAGIDNWSVIVTTQPVPEPSILTLLFCGLVPCLIFGRQRWAASRLSRRRVSRSV